MIFTIVCLATGICGWAFFIYEYVSLNKTIEKIRLQIESEENDEET